MKICPKCLIKKDETIDFYCSKDGKPYHGWCKKCLNQSQIDRWKARKAKAVEVMGGKCQSCGYCKNLAAFDFHHIDPSEKEFIWNKLNKKPWDSVLQELKKCILLCANCHREIHNPDCFLGNDFGFANSNLDRQRFSRLQSSIKSTGKCKRIECCKEVYGTTYCSTKCSSLASRKTERPSKEVLQNDILELNWKAIGRKYGVSDNAARKWARQYNLL